MQKNRSVNKYIKQDEFDFSNVFNSYISQVGIELQQKTPQSGNPSSYFDAYLRLYYSFRLFDSSAAEIEMLLSKFPNKGAPLDKIPITF